MGQRGEPQVFAIVLNWNGWRDTIECLEALQRLSYSNLRVVVVDNGSNDDSVVRIAAWAKGEGLSYRTLTRTYRYDHGLGLVPYERGEAESESAETVEAVSRATLSDEGLVLIRAGANLGFAGGCNVGLRYGMTLGAKYLWLLNNDTVVVPDALTKMVALAESEQGLGLVGSVLYYSHKPKIVQAYGGGTVDWWWATSDHSCGPPASNLDYISGASLLIRGSVAESVGLLDESYFFYWEDVAYSQRVLGAGWKLGVAEGSRVFHKEGGTVSGGGRTKSLTSDLHAVRSMILFFGRFGDARWPTAVLVRLAGVVLNRLRRRQADRIPPLLRVALLTLREVATERVAR